MKNHIIVILIMIAAILILVAVYNKGRKAGNKIVAKDLVEQVIGPPKYESLKVGTSDFKIKSPYGLLTAKNPIPEEYMTQIERVEVFDFERNPFFEGKVSYIRYKSLDYDLELGVDGAMANIKKLPGVEKIEEKSRVLMESSEYMWIVYEEVMTRNSQVGTIKGAIVKSGQDTWTIMIFIFDPDKVYIVDEILKAIGTTVQ